MVTKILFFDTNSLLKHFISERGSDVVKWLCHPQTKLRNNLVFTTNEFVWGEFSRKLDDIYNRGDIGNPLYESIKRKFPHYKGKVFRVIGEHIVSNTKTEKSYDEIIKLLDLKPGRNDWDARIYRSLCNSLAYLVGPSKPILVTSDRKFQNKVKYNGYKVINPEKHNKSEILEILSCN